MPSPYTYLDYAASAPVRACARQALARYNDAAYAGANPNSLHTPGRLARSELDVARKMLCACFHADVKPHELYFCSGATEANNWAVRGLAAAMRAKNPHRDRIIISQVEHDSIFALPRMLTQAGFRVSLAAPDEHGVVTSAAVENLLDDDVALVSCMYANNETGIIMPISEIAHAAHDAGAYMHTDAVQAFCHVPLMMSNVDAVTISAHKIGGYVGIGALMIRRGVHITPLLYGGGQEAALRSGTQAVCLASAFAAAAAECDLALASSIQTTTALARDVSKQLCDSGMFEPTSDIPYGELRLPGIVSLTHKSIDAQTLVLQLDALGFGISSGSACGVAHAAQDGVSHVLVAQGLSKEQAARSIRISFDERVSKQDLQRFIDSACNIHAQ